MLAEGGGAIEFEGAVDFEEMKVRADLHRPVSGIADLERGHRQSFVKDNRLRSADVAANGYLGRRGGIHVAVNDEPRLHCGHRLNAP